MDKQSQKTSMREDNRKPTDKPIETDWDRVLLASFFAFLSSLQCSSMEAIKYAYMRQVDELTTVAFYGTLTSMSHAFFAMATLISSYLCCKILHFSPVLLYARTSSIAACLIYLSIELLPHSKRGLVLASYLFFGVADGATSVLFLYTSYVTAPWHSATAKYVVNLGYMMGHIGGSVITVAFSPLFYSSAPLIFSKLLINAYTCPILTVLIVNVFSLVVLCFTFQKFNVETTKIVNKYSWEFVRSSFLSLRSLHISCFHWYHLVCCWLVTMVTELNYATFMTLLAPMLMIQFGLPGEETVLFLSISLIFSMCLQIGVMKILEKPFWKTNDVPRISVYVALVVVCLLYLAITILAGVHADSINSSEMPEKSTIPFVGSFLLVFVLMTGIVLPFIRTEIDRHYSSILGADQPVLNGFMGFMKQLLLIVGSQYAGSLYSSKSHDSPLLWIINWIVNLLFLALLMPFVCSSVANSDTKLSSKTK